MWLGSPQQLVKVNVLEVPVASARINVSETARILGVIVDSQLTLFAQVAAVCRCGYYQLRQLRPLVRSMSSDAVKTLVQAFISCRLDYCNSMFYGITDGLMSQLQSVKNAAARLVSGARRYDHITLVLQELHWLPVRRRMDFKMATLIYLMSLSSMAPPYLAADSQLVSDEGRRQLRSANSRTCVVRRTCSSYGNRCVAAAGPRLWNSLPAHLRQTDINFEQFKRQLKTFLFGR